MTPLAQAPRQGAALFLKDLLAGNKPLATYTKMATYMGILLPNIFVGPIRYFVADEKKDVRLRIFYRDVLAGMLGIVLFYVSKGIATPILKRMNKPRMVVEMLATLTGWVVNVAFQSVGAVKMSEWMSRKSEAKKAQLLQPKQTPPPVIPRQQVIAPTHVAPPLPPPRPYQPQPTPMTPVLNQQRYYRSDQFIPPVRPFAF